MHTEISVQEYTKLSSSIRFMIDTEFFTFWTDFPNLVNHRATLKCQTEITSCNLYFESYLFKIWNSKTTCLVAILPYHVVYSIFIFYNNITVTYQCSHIFHHPFCNWEFETPCILQLCTTSFCFFFFFDLPSRSFFRTTILFRGI